MSQEQFVSAYQKPYPDLGSECHQSGIFAVLAQTSFCVETSDGVVKCWMFSKVIKYVILPLNFAAISIA